MPTFVPPTDNFVRYADPFEKSIEHRLFRFFVPTARGRNVFKLNDGTFTEDQPGDSTTIAKVYHGGHSHTVTDAEAADLMAAGYGANLS